MLTGLLLLAAQVLSTAAFQSNDLPTGTEIIERYVRAKGGEELLRKTRNYQIETEIWIDGKKTATTQMFQAPNRHLTINTLVDGSTTQHGTDGKRAWLVAADGSVTDLQGDQLRDYLAHYSTVHEALEWSKQYEKINCVGRRSLLGGKAFEVHFIPKDGPTIVRFFDDDSGLFIREQRVLDEQGTLLVSDMSDYRRVNGIMVSHKRVNTIGGESTEYILKVAKNNVTFPDDLFQPPTK